MQSVEMAQRHNLAVTKRSHMRKPRDFNPFANSGTASQAGGGDVYKRDFTPTKASEVKEIADFIGRISRAKQKRLPSKGHANGGNGKAN